MDRHIQGNGRVGVRTTVSRVWGPGSVETSSKQPLTAVRQRNARGLRYDAYRHEVSVLQECSGSDGLRHPL